MITARRPVSRSAAWPATSIDPGDRDRPSQIKYMILLAAGCHWQGARGRNPFDGLYCDDLLRSQEIAIACSMIYLSVRRFTSDLFS